MMDGWWLPRVATLLAVVVLLAMWVVCPSSAPAKTVEGDERTALVVRSALDCGASFEMVEFILHEEALAGVPASLRGIGLARGCRESRFNPAARGDCIVQEGKRKRCRAVGLYQFWPWVEVSRYMRVDTIEREDWRASVRLWFQLVSLQMTEGRKPAKVKRYCKRQWKDTQRRWLVSMARVNRSPKDKQGNHRCRQSPLEHRRLKRWVDGND